MHAHSLINPNQLRAFGMLVQDNPYHTDPLGITPLPYNLDIPLRTAGTIIYADTRAPMQAESATLPCIALTSSADWDPQHVRFPSHDVEEARRATINAIQERQQRDVRQYRRYNIKPCLQGSVVDPATFSIRLISPVKYMTRCISKKMYHQPKPSTLLSASQQCQRRTFLGSLVWNMPHKPSSPHHNGYSGQQFYHWPNDSKLIECSNVHDSVASYTPIQCMVISNPLMGTNMHKSLQQKTTFRRHTQWKARHLPVMH